MPEVSELALAFHGVLPLLLLPSPTKAPCFFSRPRLPPRFPQLWCPTPQPLAHCSLTPQAISTQPIIVLSLELTSGARVSVPSPCPSVSCCGVCGQWYQWSVPLSLCVALLRPAAVLLSEAWRTLCLCWSPCRLGAFPECEFLSSFTAPSQECSSYPDSFPLYFFSPFVVPSYVAGSLPFLEV